MRLIRNVVMTGLLAACGVGCEFKRPGEPVALTNTPLIIDGAMQDRDREWDSQQLKATYASGSVPANADRFPLEASGSYGDEVRGFSDTPVFLANSVIFPFTYITNPPGAWVNHPSTVTPPTSNAMPPTERIGPYGLADDAARGSGNGTGPTPGSSNRNGQTNRNGENGPGGNGPGGNGDRGTPGAGTSGTSGGGAGTSGR